MNVSAHSEILFGLNTFPQVNISSAELVIESLLTPSDPREKTLCFVS